MPTDEVKDSSRNLMKPSFFGVQQVGINYRPLMVGSAVDSVKSAHDVQFSFFLFTA